MPPPAFTAPALPTTASKPATSHKSPQCTLTRRTALHLAALSLSTVLLPTKPVAAETTYEKNVRLNVAKIKLGLEKARSLKPIVATWKEPLQEEDEFYVLRFIPIWLEPARIAMLEVGEQKKVDVGDTQKILGEGAKILGHLLELKEEAKAFRKEGVMREIDEFCESCEAFLALPGVQRFIR